ncbi:MAG TPA: sigma-54 dependent transcriptional regulator [Burkholderiales bacterium]|nr:sigma-54 dependent transcriptional regulator [Burkholderiales bacterium]
MPHAVLIIEDEVILSKNLAKFLEREGFEAKVVPDGEQGLKTLDSFRPDAVLLDYNLPGINGLEVLQKIRQRDRHVKVIMVTGHGNVQVAVDAMKGGADDYLAKPVVLTELKLLLENALGRERVESRLDYYQKRDADGSSLANMVGASAAMSSLKNNIKRLVEAEFNLRDGDLPAVLITGETGTGKELVARAVHFDGPRRDKPFIELNCASIPTNLLESELFGYERGAFTDAKERKLGLAEAADGGTLFLDEIGDVDLSIQAKLLKLLEEKVIRRLGSVRDIKVDVRIIAATNRPLEQMVRENKFRSDLYFRLRMVQIPLPPLRDRGEDILQLARGFLEVQRARYGKAGLHFTTETERLLLKYAWPGNVRELRNMVEQVVLMSQGDSILPHHIPFCSDLSVAQEAASAPEAQFARAAPAGAPAGSGQSFPKEGISLEEVERNYLLQALESSGWNITQAARLLGLSRDTLRYRIEKYGLRPDAGSVTGSPS